MPHVNITIPETGQSITRPVIFDIINQVQTITKFSKEAKIYFPGDIQKMQTPGSSINDSDRSALFGTDRYNFIEIDEDYDRETLGSTVVNRVEQIPVFTDPYLKVHIVPIYATSNVQINFKYRCPSKTEALRWRDEIRVKISQLRDINIHAITYHYLLPDKYYEVLNVIHEARESYLGYGQSFQDYVVQYGTDRMVLVTDTVGKDYAIAVSETQCRIVGQFVFDAIPDKAERDDTTGAWVMSFGYKFTYEKPISCSMKYPISVHNSLLPEQYVAFADKAYRLDRIRKQFSNSLYSLFSFESDTINGNRTNIDALVHLPDFDDYILPEVPKGTGTAFVALAGIDTIDKVSILNLNDLDPYILDSDIADFIIKSEYPYITNLYRSIINVSLYRGETLLSNPSISCDTSLNIKASSELDLRCQYRIRFSLVVDLTMLDPKAMSRLLNYPSALIKIISSMNELIRNNPDVNDLISYKRITPIQFNPIYKFMTGFDLPLGLGTGYNNNSSIYNGSGYNIGTNKDYTTIGIDQSIINAIRDNMVGMKTVAISSILSFKNADLNL